MHGEGGFNLTKFMCNRKVVLQSVPGCHFGKVKEF